MSDTNTRKALKAAALAAAEAAGYVLEQKPGRGQSQNFWATRDGKRYDLTLRTSQDGKVAFNATSQKGDSWNSLDDADLVLIAALDAPEEPESGATIYMVSDVDRVHGLYEASHVAVRTKRGRDLENLTTWLPLADVLGDKAETLAGVSLDAPAERPAMADAVSGSDGPKAQAPMSVSSILGQARKDLASVLGVATDDVTVRFEVAS